MKLKFLTLLIISCFIQSSCSDVILADIDNYPSDVSSGKYNIYRNNYWVLAKKSVSEIEEEGYDIPERYSSDTLLLINYTRLNYSFKIKILTLSSTSIKIENTEMEHDLNVKIYENNGGEPGKLIATYEKEDVQANVWEWESEAPNYGVLFNPSFLKIGNKYSLDDLEFSVIRTETLSTSLGEFDAYVLEGIREGPYSIRWLKWCDSETGIILKQINNQEMSQRYISREEMNIIETGNKIEVSTEIGNIEIPIETNSFINAVNLDSDSNELNIVVEGETDTKGEFNITIPKIIVPSEHEFNVYVDNQKIEHTLFEDSDNFYIYTEYQHSSHTIKISFTASSGIPGFPLLSIIFGIIILISSIYSHVRAARAI